MINLYFQKHIIHLFYHFQFIYKLYKNIYKILNFDFINILNHLSLFSKCYYSPNSINYTIEKIIEYLNNIFKNKIINKFKNLKM